MSEIFGLFERYVWTYQEVERLGFLSETVFLEWVSKSRIVHRRISESRPVNPVAFVSLRESSGTPSVTHGAASGSTRRHRLARALSRGRLRQVSDDTSDVSVMRRSAATAERTRVGRLELTNSGDNSK